MIWIDNYNGEVHSDVVEQFTEFLEQYAQDDIASALQNGDDSFRIDLEELYRFDSDLAMDLVDHPETMFAHITSALALLDMPAGNPEELTPRVGNVEWEVHTSELRDSDHRDRYLGVKGQVSMASQVQPRVTEAVFRCERCSTAKHDVIVGPIPQYSDEIRLPEECDSCERKGPFSLHEEKSTTVDHQIVELRDEPGHSPGTQSHTIPVHLFGDVAGTVAPGDRIRVNGHVQTKREMASGNGNLSTRRPWVVYGRAVDSEQVAFEDVDPERVDEIEALAERDDLRQLFVDSFAPDILTSDRGDKHKLSFVLQMFGGVSAEGKRGDINIILIGEPGTGKSQYLRRAEEIAPKAVQASGKGATAAGLTATARKSDYGEGYVLDAGALVMASGGLACIDEFDKMHADTRKSMHEAMENQRVPITKAGINTTLTTETAVLAAANPEGGRFNRFTNVSDQINIGPTLLSRFDLRFGLKDAQDADKDRAVAAHQHRDGMDDQAEAPLDDELMTEYIAHARQNYDPEYESDEVRDILVEYYVKLRQQAAENEDAQPPTPRVNDALRRLAQASARMRLSDTVTEEDAQVAIDLMKLTIGDTALDEEGNPDWGGVESTPSTQEDRIESVKDILRDADEPLMPGQVADRIGIDEEKVEKQLKQLAKQGRVVKPQGGGYRNV